MNDGAKRIIGKRVALLVEDHFDDPELLDVADILKSHGADVVIVGPTAPTVFRGRRGSTITSDLAASRIRSEDLDAVIIPGGFAPDKMRMRHAMVDLVRNSATAGKTVAAICHGVQLLISARSVSGRQITCWPSVAVDVKNAGGLYMDRPVVVDENIITSRKSDDIPSFADAIVEALERQQNS